MATTTGGTTYVTSTDLVANYPMASLALANRVDVVASGSMSKKTASYTVTVADILAGTTIAMNSASATVITLPSTSLVNGMMLNVFSVNTGAVTFTGGTVTGTVNSITAQYTGVSLTYDSAAAVWWCLPFGGGSARATVTGTTGSPATGTSGGKTWYRWTGSGSVTIGTAGFLSCLVVAGGGGGDSSGATSGGGGSGGHLNVTDVYFIAGTYSVTVGAGGAAASHGNASICNYIAAPGGGKGGGPTPATRGGSGGGAQSTGAAGAGLAGEGFAGGTGTVSAGGGGGGASVVGSNGVGTVGGAGGAGVSTSLDGTATTRGGGGGGSGTSASGAGGAGGGGAGGATAVAGTANTGGGGGAGGTAAGGGSGIVILSIG